MRWTGFCALLAAGVWLGAGPGLRADELADARKLIDEKKYDQVDVVLDKELAKPAPAVEALKLSLTAALNGGRYVTAQKRITRLLQATKNADAELVYQGAEIAMNAGNDRVAMTRYLMFTRMVKEKSPTLEVALRTLLRNGAYPDEYRRFVDTYGASGEAWNLGAAQLERLCQLLEGEKALDLAGLLLRTFKDPTQREHVAWRLKQASDDFQLGKSDDLRVKRPLLVLLENQARGVSQGYWNHFYDTSEGQFSAQERVDNLFKIQDLIGQPVAGGFFYRFDRIRALPNEPERLEAGKRYLALEKMYADAADPELYQQFLHFMAESPQVFHVAGKELVSDADMINKFMAMKARFQQADRWTDYNHYLHHIQNSYLGGDNRAARLAFLRQNLDVMEQTRFRELMDLSEGKDLDALRAEYLKGKSYCQQLLLDVELMGWYNQLKLKEPLLAAARDYGTAYPGSFNHQQLIQQLLRSALVTPDEKVAFVKDLATKSGAHQRVKEMVAAMAGLDEFKTHAGFAELKKFVDGNPAGTDPLLTAHVRLTALPPQRNVNNPQAHELAREFLAKYQGQVPGDQGRAKNAAELLAYNMFEYHGINLCWDNNPAIAEWAQIWAPRLGAGRGWALLLQRCREHQHYGLLQQQVLPAFLTMAKTAEKIDADIWWQWAEIGNPRGQMKSGLWDFFPQMGPATALYYVFNQRGHMDQNRKEFIDALGAVAKQGGYQFASQDQARDMINHLYYWSSDQSPVDPELTRKLFEFYVAAEDRTKRYDPYIEAFAYAHYVRSGNAAAAAAHWQNYLNLIKTRSPWDQLQSVQAHVHHVGLPAEPNDQLEAGKQYYTVLKVLKPMYDQMSAGERRLSWVSSNAYAACENVLRNWKNEEARKLARDFGRLQVDLLLDGCRFEGNYHQVYGLLDYFIREAVQQQQWAEAARLVAYHGGLYEHEGWDGIFQWRVQPIAGFLESQKAYELLFSTASPAGPISRRSTLASSWCSSRAPPSRFRG